jgi:hypothetical protein
MARGFLLAKVPSAEMNANDGLIAREERNCLLDQSRMKPYVSANPIQLS